jgi:hypothetical protein
MMITGKADYPMKPAMFLVLACATALCVLWPDASSGAPPAGDAAPPSGRGAAPPTGGRNPTTLPVPDIVGVKRSNTGIGVGDGGTDTTERPYSSQAEFENYMKLAQDLYDKGSYYDALARANQARLEMTENSQLQRVLAFMRQLNQAGQTQLTGYLKLLEMKEYVKALKGLGVVNRTFGQLPCAIAARRALDKAKNDPEIKSALREVKAEELDAAVDRLIDSAPPQKPSVPASGPAAQSLQSPTSDDSAQPNRANLILRLPPWQADPVVAQLEQIVKTCVDTPTGERVRKELEIIHADAKFAAALEQYRRDSKAAGLLEMADKFLHAGQDAAAAKNLQRVIKEFPKTAWADKAKAKLATIREESGG